MFTLAIIAVVITVVRCSSQPNIVVILADDLGYNDVGYRGNNEVKTPNIDALAYHGVTLNKFYTMPTCTPSRAALLTGNYPIRSGLQGFPIAAGEERHLPWDMPTMPEQLKKLGYKSHLVGKWHLGSGYKNSTPIMRGFDSHYGYYNGYVGYFDHAIMEGTMNGLDFRNNFAVAKEDTGKYATDLFTSKSIHIIEDHDYRKPLFLLLSHLAPHTGKSIASRTTILEEKDTDSMNRNFGYIKDANRRKYVDIVKSLDESVGLVVKSLSKRGVLKNTIILFMSDNGGQTFGLHQNYASNWPLRGLKFTNFEGAVKSTAILYSSFLSYKDRTNNNLMHMSDLLPTFYAAGGGNVDDLGKIDGINQLPSLIYNKPTTRKDILVNIDEVANMSAIISNSGRYKLVQGSFVDKTYNLYAGDSGRGSKYPHYDAKAVLNSDINKALRQYRLTPMTKLHIEWYRRTLVTDDCRQASNVDTTCYPACLFDLFDDACETINIADDYPNIVKKLQQQIAEYNVELVPQQNKAVDPASNPEYFGGSWSTWLDANPI